MQPQQQGADSSDAEISLEPGANQAGEAMMQRVYRRLDPSPGVIPLDSNRGLVARVLRLSTGRFPLTDAILRRWMPAAGDAWGYGPELLYLARDRGDASLAGDTALWGLPLAGQSRPDVPVVAGTPVMRADADLAATGLRARPAASCELPSGLSHRLAQPNEQPAVATRLAPAVARQAAASAGQGFAPARAGPPDTRPLPVAASEPSQATAIASSVSAAPIVMPRVVGSAPAGTIARRWPDRRAAAGAPPSPSWEMLQPLHEGAPGPRARRSEQQLAHRRRSSPGTRRIRACACGPGCCTRIAGYWRSAASCRAGHVACRNRQQHSD